METKKYPLFLSKCNSLQNNAIDKFREYVRYLQIRLTDFAYFHSNDKDSLYLDLINKSQQLYETTEKILSFIFESLIPDDTNPTINRNESIDYINSIYNEVKDKKSVYYEIKKAIKEICQNRDPNDFKEIFNSSEICLKTLGIELTTEEMKLFKKNLDKLLQNKAKIENPINIDEKFEPSEEKELLLGQVLSEYCLYNSIKLLKQSKSSFKESCKKINSAYRTDVENILLMLQNQITDLITENENLKQEKEKNTLKLKDDEIQIEELQEHLDMISAQNKKLSDEILELKGNASSPDIIYNLDDSADEIDTGEILKFLSETEPENNNNNQNIPYRPRNLIPPILDEEFIEFDRNPGKLTVHKVNPYTKKVTDNKQTNKEVLNNTNNKNDTDNRNNIDDANSKLLLKQLEEKDIIIQKLQKNIANLVKLYQEAILL